jgi:nucleotide-binding universal stress UspA family protein
MYKEILLAIDLEDESSWKKALPAAVEMCKSSGARLHALTVVPELGPSIVSGYFPEDYEARMIADAGKRLGELMETQLPEGLKARPIVAQGTVYKIIIDTAEGIGADLIVIASHRPESSDYLLGPNAARVVRHSDKSVLVVR